MLLADQMGVIQGSIHVNLFLKNGDTDYIKFYEGTVDEAYNRLSHSVFMCEVERCVVSGLNVDFYIAR